MEYFRITGYNEKDNYCFIVDSNGMFEKLWQFSAYLISKGLKILEVSKEENFIDVNIKRATEDKENIILRANAVGKPKNTTYEIDGVSYKAIQVADKIYIPNKDNNNIKSTSSNNAMPVSAPVKIYTTEINPEPLFFEGISQFKI